VYAITDAGRAELTEWLHELVAEPEPEYPRFGAALSVVGVLPPDEVTALLQVRLRALDADIAARRGVLEKDGAWVPRVFLIEADYALAMRQAEAAWVRSLLKEISEGTLSGLAEWREYHRAGGVPPQWTQLLEDMAQQPTDHPRWTL
jgi:hypothetical protein